MSTNNIKPYITRYVLMKIGAGDWKRGSKLPSENTLSLKFECSRPTVRNILQNLVYSGILEATKGSGYVVSNSIDMTIFAPVGERFGADKAETSRFDNFNKVFSECWFNKFNLEAHSFKRSFGLEKMYYKNNKKIIHQFSFLNKDLIEDIDIKMINNSLTQFLIYNGLVITSTLEMVLFDNFSPMLNEIARSMGWEKDFPLVFSILKSTNNWIEVSIKIISIEEFNFQKNTRVYL